MRTISVFLFKNLKNKCVSFRPISQSKGPKSNIIKELKSNSGPLPPARISSPDRQYFYCGSKHFFEEKGEGVGGMGGGGGAH